MMTVDIRVLDRGGEGPWPELGERPTEHAEVARFAVIQGGMKSGASSVRIIGETDDGTVVVLETSAKLFSMMAGAVRGALGRWGEGPY